MGKETDTIVKVAKVRNYYHEVSSAFSNQTIVWGRMGSPIINQVGWPTGILPIMGGTSSIPMVVLNHRGISVVEEGS